MLKKVDISGGTLSGDGLTATIYNPETFDDAQKAQQSADQFRDKVNKLYNDNRGRIRVLETTPAKFREFHRGGSKVAQNDYDWIASNLHPSETYKQRLGGNRETY